MCRPVPENSLLQTRLNNEEAIKAFGAADEVHQEYVLAVIAYINSHYSQDISLEEITQHAYLSKFHFSRIFKRYTSYSPYAYLVALRLEKAKLLLSAPDSSVKWVAARCGFKRIDYFSAMFKKKFQCSPSEYRCSNHVAQL